MVSLGCLSTVFSSLLFLQDSLHHTMRFFTFRAPYTPLLMQIMTSRSLSVVLQSLQTTTALTGGSHNEYPSWSEPTITKTNTYCFSEHHHLRTIPEKAWTRAASPETPPLCACRKTSQKTQALSLCHPKGTSTFQEKRDLVLIDWWCLM